MRIRIIIFVAAVFFLRLQIAHCEAIYIKGQLSSWLIGRDEAPVAWQAAARYIPELTFERQATADVSFDFLASLNTYAVADFYGDTSDSDAGVKAHRIWGRLSTRQMEARIGLQKINFGPAMLLRPLKWFDRIDPRDPLQLTDGVYGALMRYYFLNNANIWLWGLYGNDDIKGGEIAPTAKGRPELGGRLQIPLFTGEAALSCHHRIADFSELIPGGIDRERVSEDRVGVDGKWDMGVGLWFEGVFSRYGADADPLKHQQAFTLGLDDTFEIGNGLRVLGEHYFSKLSGTAFGSGTRRSLSGIFLDYPFGLVDALSLIVFYDWENSDFYRTLTWQRLYDDWSFYLTGFWNPDQPPPERLPADDNNFSGWGFQLMATFNH